MGCELFRMRFIGSKAALLGCIESAVNENAEGGEQTFCDLFSGTGVVANYFKPRYTIYSNDLLHFSYVIQKAVIENNTVPGFQKLKRIGIADPFRFLEETAVEPAIYKPGYFFLADNYSPRGECGRMYLSEKNAMRVDFIRNTIEAWKEAGLLDEPEYYYLLAGLVEGVPSVSNITGTYGAYLKKWDKRAFKNFEMVRLNVTDNGRRNLCFNEDANRLIERLEGDILYLDPPYNSRQYAPNYHLLETVSKYDHPKIQGVTGMRPYEDERSAFCAKREVADVFEDLIAKARFSHILLSYSSDGLMTSGQIETILKKYGIENSFQRYDIPYRKYKSKIPNENALREYLFYVRKKAAKPHTFVLSTEKASTSAPQQAARKKYLKSPLNYIGGKYRLLPQMMPYFPADIATFADLFCGGANVAVNVAADHILCSDINSKIIEMFQAFQQTQPEKILEQIEGSIQHFGLSKENEAGFLAFREHYNRAPNPIDLYTLTCFSFNYQFRFNNHMEYNNPFGRGRSRFSENMKKNLAAFTKYLQSHDIHFACRDFTKTDLSRFGPQDFIYCDPPYLITTGSYNDGRRGFQGWGEAEEEKLYRLLDRASAKHLRFALSNVLEHKGRVNRLLLEWSRKYHVIELNADYSNASYNTKRSQSREVLIINY